ncbi:MAG: co-chaperone GroES [Planctomycetota bacterium]|nr:co-chaperone GroES [Planctomycetota bacterium]
MKIKPLDDRVLVRPVESEDKTPGGIIIPDTAKDKSTEGEVIATGPGKLNKVGKRVAPEIKTGDRVIYSKYGGTEIMFDGEKYLLMSEDGILAIVNK